jgi:hypothetical protein
MTAMGRLPIERTNIDRRKNLNWDESPLKEAKTNARGRCARTGDVRD